MLIAEVTLTDELKYGIDWFINARSGMSMGGSGVLEPNVTRGTLNLGGLPPTPTGAVPAFAGLQLINSLGGDVRGVLNALGTDSRLKIVSSPSLMVIDNQKAQIQVGSRVPTLSSQQAGATSGVGGNVISSIQYLDTGILLNVTPRVNSGGRITLEVAQEVSEAAATQTSGIDSPTITKRTAQSVVTTQSGRDARLRGPHPEQAHLLDLGRADPLEDSGDRRPVRHAGLSRREDGTDPAHHAEADRGRGQRARRARRAAAQDAACSTRCTRSRRRTTRSPSRAETAN